MAAELTLGLLLYPFWRLAHRRHSPRRARALWLQVICKRLLRLWRTRIEVHGDVPFSGLVVSNHLTYLDILVICSTTPAVFVAKREISGWPVFGWFAILAGTVFVDRSRRSVVADVANEVKQALGEGALVVLFPEGTSSDGSTVLPFRPSLLQPVAEETYAAPESVAAESLDPEDAGAEVIAFDGTPIKPVNVAGMAFLVLGMFMMGK
jgi:1-acyl-sn-glycerol-3-phosphate acyltransferase